MRAATSEAAVLDFYKKNGWKPVWTETGAKALTDALAQRRRHGLDHIEFAVDPTGPNLADNEVARTSAALRYASALAKGKVDPATLHEIYTLPTPDIDLPAGLSQALSSGSLASWLEGLAPQDAEYQQLSQAYLRYSEAPAASAAEEIAASGLIKVGDADPRLSEILQDLRGAGYLPARPAGEDAAPEGETAPPVYTEAAAQAVKQLQRAYGVAVDGVIGPDTLQILNLGPGDRARALAVALERRRWLRRSPDATRIDVNVASARLAYFRDGHLADSRKVVVGKPGNETPALMSPIYRLVANPTWTIPKSIQNGELANVGQDYLDSHNMIMRDGWIVQQPGPDNALGQVKFDMINQHAIYLHDTSAPSLFERSERHRSHGCVRVEDALGFAQLLAKDEGITDQWAQARQSGEQTFVDLPERIPVRLLYHNVFVDEAGQISFRMDPYGWNNAVASALGFTVASDKTVKAESADIGP